MGHVEFLYAIICALYDGFLQYFRVVFSLFMTFWLYLISLWPFRSPMTPVTVSSLSSWTQYTLEERRLLEFGSVFEMTEIPDWTEKQLVRDRLFPARGRRMEDEKLVVCATPGGNKQVSPWKSTLTRENTRENLSISWWPQKNFSLLDGRAYQVIKLSLVWRLQLSSSPSGSPQCFASTTTFLRYGMFFTRAVTAKPKNIERKSAAVLLICAGVLFNLTNHWVNFIHFH